MNTAFVLLYSTDTALAKLVRVAVSNTSACRFDRVSDKTAANQRLYAGGVELVLLHLADSTQEPNVVRLLREASALGVPAVLIVDQHDPALLIRLLRHGAADCLERPLNISRLELLIDILTMRSRHAPVEEPASQPGDEPEDDDLAPFLVVSSKMRSVVQQIRKVTHLDGTILLTGETGTGKSCLARVIHRLSARSARPFLDINCGAISPTLVESEMFGHVRGAFTGADCNHEGKLAQVADGTLLLDEIDSLPMAIQAKLLRAVEERVFEPVGSNKTQAMQARLIVASNRHLEEEVACGRFRSDLYFRLNVLGFHIPPLRERRESIPRLVSKYIIDFRNYRNGQVTSVDESALTALMTYHWPGNVRELRNVIERAVAVCSGSYIEVSDLSQAIQRCVGGELPHDEPQELQDRSTRPPEGVVQDRPLNQLAAARGNAERQLISNVLRRTNNNRSHAALELGISRVTLYKKLRKHGLA